MSAFQRGYQTADREKVNEDVSDQEEDALVEDYREQVQFDDGMEPLDRTSSFGTGAGGPQDMQAQLTAAATPLEYQATLETKFASYDNYCNLFHYILNSEGPVDLETPSVRYYPRNCLKSWAYIGLMLSCSIIGPGMSLMSSFTNLNLSVATAIVSPVPILLRKMPHF